MAAILIVHRGRTNIEAFDLGQDVTGDTITAEIRATPASTSTLLATWTVAVTTASTGVGTLTLDNSATASITAADGYMDMLRTTGGEPVSLFDEPIHVVFVDMPTAVSA